MKNFITIFEKCENIHLIKDVGQIPYLMYRYFGFKSKIVTYKNSKEYNYLDKEVEGLELKFLPKIKVGRYSLSILWYLFFHAKDIDVLHLFHHREKTYLNFLMYKWRNPDGVAFLKSDIGLNTLKEYGTFFAQTKPKYWIRNWLLKKAIKKIDIISIESDIGIDIVKNKYRKYENKFLFLPNGINLENMHTLVPLKSFAEKQNIVLTVGRIGAKEKNNELLLEAISNINITNNYQFIFIGPIEKEFQSTINRFYIENPKLKNSVRFLGLIEDRRELYEWYAKSKIFCLTSIEESFGFVLIEAMAYKNFIITTPISSANEITDDKRCGMIISSQKELVKALEYCMSNDEFLQNKANLILDKVNSSFNWKKRLKILNDKIEEKT